MATARKWTEAEDDRLYRQVKAFPQNLHKCFLMVAEELGRTPGAVESRWYTYVSRKPQYAGFVTLSAQHKSLNRKNGTGEPSTEGVFNRVLRLLGIR